MGQLDEPAFEAAIAACPACPSTAFDIASYVDRQVSVMLGDADNDGKWAYDGEKFVDGVYRITCAGCQRAAVDADMCPRCHRPGGLADALAGESKLAVPKKCPKCSELELLLVGFAPATVRVTGGGKVPTPKPTALYGEPGFHVIAVACDACSWAVVAEGCPLCGAAGPMRARP